MGGIISDDWSYNYLKNLVQSNIDNTTHLVAESYFASKMQNLSPLYNVYLASHVFQFNWSASRGGGGSSLEGSGADPCQRCRSDSQILLI